MHRVWAAAIFMLLFAGCLDQPNDVDIDDGADLVEQAASPIFARQDCEGHNMVHLFPEGTLSSYGPDNWTERPLFGAPLVNVRILLVLCADMFVLYHSIGMQVDEASEHHVEDDGGFADVLIDIVSDDAEAVDRWQRKGFAAKIGVHSEEAQPLTTRHDVVIGDSDLVVTFQHTEPIRSPRSHTFNQSYTTRDGDIWGKGVEQASTATERVVGFEWGPGTVLSDLPSTPTRMVSERLLDLTIAFLEPGADLPPADRSDDAIG